MSQVNRIVLKNMISYKNLFTIFVFSKGSELSISIISNIDIIESIRSILLISVGSLLAYSRYNNNVSYTSIQPDTTKALHGDYLNNSHLTTHHIKNVRDNIDMAINNVNNHTLYDHLNSLFHLLHNNIHLFIGLIAILIYSILPRITKTSENFWLIIIQFLNCLLKIILESDILNKSNYNNDYDFEKWYFHEFDDYIHDYYTWDDRKLDQVSQKLDISNFNHDIIVNLVTCRYDAFLDHNRTFLALNSNHTNFTDVIINNRNFIYDNILSMNSLISRFIHVTDELNQIGGIFAQDRDGQPSSQDESLLGVIPENQEQGIRLYELLVGLNERISASFFEIAETLGYNRAIFDRVFPTQPLLDLDLWEEMHSILDDTYLYDLETFNKISEESTIKYINQHFNPNQ